MESYFKRRILQKPYKDMYKRENIDKFLKDFDKA